MVRAATVTNPPQTGNGDERRKGLKSAVDSASHDFVCLLQLFRESCPDK